MKYHFRGRLGKVEYEFNRDTGQYSEDGHFNNLLYVKANTESDEQNLFGSLPAW